MTDKKEPPFFNDESVGGFHYKLPLYDIIELFIETLTGTCFELRVFPFEAVISVKAKIQRLEGIPVAQQHLIWNNLELDDERCLHDYGIAGGCTLKLVLAMRGGPINIRRVTMEDPIKEVTDLMENTKDEGWEKSSPNKPVTFVLYREGDRLNFFKVIDRGDGTLTPLSESLSTCSMHNVCIDEEEDGESCAAVQQCLENAITMNKMKLLKAKMEDMNLNKKPKKLAKIKPRPPVSPHPFSGSAGSSSARHHHRLSRLFSHVNQPRQSNPLLPPISDQKSVDPSSASAATISSHFSIHRQPPPSFSPTSCYVLQEEEPWDTCPPFANIRPPPKVSRLDIGSTRLMRDCIYPQPPPPCVRGPPDANYDPAEPAPEAVRLGLLEEAVERGMPTQPGTLFAELSDPLSLDVSTPPDRGSRSLEVGAQHQMPLSPSPLSTWTFGTSDTLTSRDDWTLLGTSLHINPSSQMHAPASPSNTTRYLPHNPHAQSSAQVKPGSTSPHLPTGPSANPPRLHGVTVESLGKRPELISKSNTRSITKMNNQACREPLGSLSKSDFVASLSTRASESMDSLNKSLGHALAFPRATASEQGRLGSRLPTFPTNRLLQDDLMRQMSPFHTATASDMAPPTVASAGGLMASIERLGKTCHLPPVKTPAGSKKKNFKHCFHCSKKTGLATSYECRCGHNFCATHRYAETHDCTFDYKNAGRQFLQETNPMVSAPKLPKI